MYRSNILMGKQSIELMKVISRLYFNVMLNKNSLYFIIDHSNNTSLMILVLNFNNTIISNKKRLSIVFLKIQNHLFCKNGSEGRD